MSPLSTKSETPPPLVAPSPSVVVCIDCGASVFEWSTPHVDRCWECAEILDFEPGP